MLGHLFAKFPILPSGLARDVQLLLPGLMSGTLGSGIGRPCLKRSLLMNRTLAAVPGTVDAQRALTRTDLVLCALPIALFLSIVSLV